MELWQILIGLATAIILIFIKDAHAKAQKQKIVAIRLQSYLLYWQGVILDNNLFAFFHMGVKWNEEINELLKNGGSNEDLVTLKHSKKKEMDKLKKHFLSEAGLKTLTKEEIEKTLKKLPQNSTDFLIKYVTMSSQNLIDGKTFITDEEASHLGFYIAQVSIEMKMELISTMNSLSGLIINMLSTKEDLDTKEYVDEIVKLIWKAMVVSKHIDTLTKRVQFFTNRTIVDLTLLNLKGTL